MKVIGFIDDAEYELEAFQKVAGKTYKVVTSQHPDDFLERLGLEKRIDLLLFDLYFPIPGREPGDTFSESELGRKAEPLLKKCEDFSQAGSPDKQLALADFVRREADKLMKNLLSHYAQGPEGGIEIFRKVQEKYPMVPCAFLSRKRTADDISQCLNVGALRVLLKPSPQREADTGDATQLALWGWEDQVEHYIDEFNSLMEQDIVDIYLTRIEEMLSYHDFKKSKHIRKAILKAKRLWVETDRGEKDINTMKIILMETAQKYKEEFGVTASYDLIKFLSGIAAGGLL